MRGIDVMRRFWITCLFVMLSQSALVDALEYWQRVSGKQWDYHKLHLYYRSEMRLLNHPNSVRFWMFSECARYEADKTLDLEVHYSFLETRPPLGHGFRYTHRLELEANPKCEIRKGLRLQLRNRYEVMKEQINPVLQQRIRLRPRLTFELENSDVESWSIHDEFFYNINTGEFFQNRFVPIELSIKVKEHVRFIPAIMWVSRLVGERWENGAALVMEVAF
jgi:hypothetical protein